MSGSEPPRCTILLNARQALIVKLPAFNRMNRGQYPGRVPILNRGTVNNGVESVS
jgi:hypothetical protein